MYTGIDRETGNEVTWRVIKPGRFSYADFVSWFQSFKRIENLQHPNVVNYLHSEMRSGNEAILIEEMVTAGSLRSFLTTFNNPKLRICQSWLLQLIDGLEFLHNKHIVHGSISCGHVYLNTNTGELKIGDLALLHMLNLFHGNWKIPHDDIRNFGIVMLEIALTQLFGSNKRIKKQIMQLYDSNIENTRKIQKKLISLFSLKSYISLIELCFNSLPHSITISQLKEHQFFKENIDGYLSDIIKQSTISNKRNTRKKRYSRKFWSESVPELITNFANSLNFKEGYSEINKNIWFKITKNTLCDLEPKNTKFIDICITLKYKGNEYEKKVQFKYNLQKDTVFGITEEMRAQQIFSEEQIWLISIELHKIRIFI